MNRSEAAKIGAKWWTEQIKKGHPQNIGGSAMSEFAQRAREAVKSIAPLTEQKLSIFQSHLETGILDLLSRSDWLEDDPIQGFGERIIGVDYHPDKELLDAIEAASISDLFLPLKTMMWIDPDGVKVSLGYGEEIETIGLENTENREKVRASIDWEEAK